MIFYLFGGQIRTTQPNVELKGCSADTFANVESCKRKIDDIRAACAEGREGTVHAAASAALTSGAAAVRAVAAAAIGAEHAKNRAFLDQLAVFGSQ